MDNISKKRRSWNMSRIKSKNTKPEIQVRSYLHRKGLRFRLHVKNLPGKPDIVMPKYKTIIFVHGCFWHRHNCCMGNKTPKHNSKFWKEKFQKNIMRDKRTKHALEQLGWNVLIIWECEIESSRILKLINKIKRNKL